MISHEGTKPRRKEIPRGDAEKAEKRFNHRGHGVHGEGQPRRDPEGAETRRRDVSRQAAKIAKVRKYLRIKTDLNPY